MVVAPYFLIQLVATSSGFLDSLLGKCGLSFSYPLPRSYVSLSGMLYLFLPRTPAGGWRRSTGCRRRPRGCARLFCRLAFDDHILI